MEYKIKADNLKIHRCPIQGETVIVAFTSKNTGSLVYTDDPAMILPVGDHSSNWKEEVFTPFNGSITLSNEDS